MTGIRHSICKPCTRVYRDDYNERFGREALHARIRQHTERYRDQNRLYVDNYLRSHPCVDCGESNIVALEFDHVHGKKRKAISVLAIEAANVMTLQAEIDKCDVRCANCHRVKTAIQRFKRRARLAGGPVSMLFV